MGSDGRQAASGQASRKRVALRPTGAMLTRFTLTRPHRHMGGGDLDGSPTNRLPCARGAVVSCVSRGRRDSKRCHWPSIDRRRMALSHEWVARVLKERDSRCGPDESMPRDGIGTHPDMPYKCSPDACAKRWVRTGSCSASTDRAGIAARQTILCLDLPSMVIRRVSQPSPTVLTGFPLSGGSRERSTRRGRQLRRDQMGLGHL